MYAAEELGWRGPEVVAYDVGRTEIPFRFHAPPSGTTPTFYLDDVKTSPLFDHGYVVVVEPGKLSEGPHTLRAERADLLPEITTITFVVDHTPPPAPVIVGGPSLYSSVGGGGAAMTLGGLDPDAEPLCVWLNRGDVVPTRRNFLWHDPYDPTIGVRGCDLTSLPHDGKWTFWATATDPVGNVNAAPVQRTFFYDTTPPIVRLGDLPAEGSVFTMRLMPSVFVSDESQWSSLGPSLVIRCRLTREGWSGEIINSCTGGVPTDGRWTVEVWATDPAGNVSVPVRRSFTVDATPPVLRVLQRPKDTVRLRGKRTARVRFRFGSDEAVTYYCKLDKRPRRACGATFRAKVGPGKHVLRVTPRDSAGLTGASRRVVWTVVG
ncbi:hypothetical protein [Nocardioides sp.]|uniref:hypothetical protein n=1 Tax=Nocardioides sp. TaxID=35761 RepID=UPI002ED7C9C8